METTFFPFENLENFISGFGGEVVWVILLLTAGFSLFSLFIIRYHLSRYSVSKKEALLGELFYIVVSVIAAFFMITSLMILV
jgi:hypothetical protein